MEASGRRRRAGRIATWAAAAAVALLCLPTAGAARPGDEVRPRSLHLSMASVGTRGYFVAVETRGHRRVTLTVRKGSQIAEYSVRGSVSRHRVRADFGRFGRVALRFRGRERPFQRRRGSRPNRSGVRTRCVGRKPEREVGRFRGRLEFEGPRGFTRLAVGAARGEVRRSYREVCRRERRRGVLRLRRLEGGGNALGLTLLVAHARQGKTLTRFEALTLEPSPGLPLPASERTSFVSAELRERFGRVRVRRSVFLESEPGAVRVSRRGVRPRTARVDLAAPFEGLASYRGATRRSPASWTGSLAVRLLGSGRVPLTGPGFRPVLCRITILTPNEACLRRAGASARLRSAALPTLHR
ncbi:MAG TPA: hypothetical protein VGV69_06145 [Solirubrobacterales bacterium]|nr:hypothetical protein [Solirubrobacterales bacterium]